MYVISLEFCIQTFLVVELLPKLAKPFCKSYLNVIRNNVFCIGYNFTKDFKILSLIILIICCPCRSILMGQRNEGSGMEECLIYGDGNYDQEEEDTNYCNLD